MNDPLSNENHFAQNAIITNTPPFIWPNARDMSGVSAYAQTPPGKEFLVNADLISGVIVGASVETINWVKNVLSASEEKRLYLILILHPAGPTRAEHLKSLLTAISANDGSNAKVSIRIRTMNNWLAADGMHMTLPPTAIQYHNTKSGRTLMSVGSTGDVGHDLLDYGSLNLVFYPDDAVRDEWRRWFQYMFEVSAQLIPEICDIPQLIPAKGDPKSDLLWWKYAALCSTHTGSDDAKPTVDAQTGEVTKAADGKDVVAWDGGVTALDPLAKILQQVYSEGSLVTVDETTRIKPLAVPVLATLLGQKSEHVVGAVTRKQSFTLKVLDDSIEKEVETCRKISDLTELLAYPLSTGNRWLPDQAKPLLEKEVDARDIKGRGALWKNLLGQFDELQHKTSVLAALHNLGFTAAIKALIKRHEAIPDILDSDIKILQAIINTQDKEDAELRAALVRYNISHIIDSKKASITKDLNQMYHELGQGECVPPDKLAAVLKDVEKRLENALRERITPRPVYNQISAPALTNNAPPENWSQPLALLTCAATTMRESLTDAYFSLNFKKRTFKETEYLKAMDVFGDTILQTKDTAKAQDELRRIVQINDSADNAKQKCQHVWNLIKGEPIAD